MKLTAFLDHHRLDNSLLIGFYGGGNYGDELLMEILACLLASRKVRNVAISYQRPELYGQYHHDFGFTRVDIRNKKAMLGSIMKAKNVIVGGGGLWGMDTNLNILTMSIMLFVSRRILRRKVYLLAVGYYDSASRVGRISAWFAGKAANYILARDEETFRNFKRIQGNTDQGTDIAWYVEQLDLEPYSVDLAQLEKRVQVKGKTLFMTLRRFGGPHKHHLAAVIAQCLQQNTDKSIIIALLEPRHIDPEGYQLLESWQGTNPNIQILDFTFNPVALFLFFRKHHEQLAFIGPQFHGILSAHLTGVPYMPITYDNKVQNLLRSILPEAKPISIQSLNTLDLQTFIDRNCREIA